MSPTVRQRHRRVIFECPTGALEWWGGLALGVAGLWLIWFDIIPWYVQSRLLGWMTHDAWGVLLAVTGFTQWWLADTRSTHRRAMVATFTAVLITYVVGAYVEAGELRRIFLPLVSIIALGEMWVAWRAWHDWEIARQTRGLDRRRHDD